MCVCVVGVRSSSLVVLWLLVLPVVESVTLVSCGTSDKTVVSRGEECMSTDLGALLVVVVVAVAVAVGPHVDVSCIVSGLCGHDNDGLR